jgi:sugar/nucleoside kinase (ribokinase family)
MRQHQKYPYDNLHSAHSRNQRLLLFLEQHPQIHLTLVPGGAQLDLLSQLLKLHSLKIMMLCIDRLSAATGDYSSERALLDLGSQNPGAVIIATSPQCALATQGGRMYRAMALRLNRPPCGEGKSAAFLAGFLALLLEAADITQALRAGHANAAAVAQSWQPVKDLCNRNQVEPFLVAVGDAPTDSYYLTTIKR